MVTTNRGVESGVMAATCRQAAVLWQRQPWGLAVQLLEAEVGVHVDKGALVTTDAWPHLPGARPGWFCSPREARLRDEEAWYAVAERVARQLFALASSPLVRSKWWLEPRPHLQAEELCGLLRLGNGASWVYRRQAVTIPAEEAEDPEVVSVASHSTHSLFGSDVEMAG